MSRVHFPLREGEIRILTLRAGEATDAIFCSLHTAVLDERPEYEALSNAWGDPDVTVEICVDGWWGDVTVNLMLRCGKSSVPSSLAGRKP